MELYFLRNYCNYFNRQVKYRETLTQYLEDREQEDYFIVHNANFNPNDGVTTEHVVGSGHNPFNKIWTPDYLLVVDWPTGGAPRIVSRWYVLDFPRIMGTQNKAVLKRDEACDLYEPLLDAPAYIKKATLQNNSPLIVNSEGMNLNQRKVAEYLLRDKSKVPWVVVYLAPNVAKDGIAVNVDLPTNIPDLETDTSQEARTLRSMFLEGGSFTTDYNHNILMDLNMKLYFRTWQYISVLGYYRNLGVSLGRRDAYEAGFNSGGTVSGHNDSNMGTWFAVGTGQENQVLDQTNNFSMALMLDYNNFWNYIKQKHPELTKSEIVDHDVTGVENGKIWKYGNQYYELVKDEDRYDTNQIYFDSIENDYLYQKAQQSFTNRNIEIKNNVLKFWDAKVHHVHYRLQLKQGLTATLDIKAGRKHPEEVPYDIIAFPYQPIRVDQWGKDIDDIASLAAARSIAMAFTNPTGCYDVQILPYCPVPEYINSDGDIDLGDAQEGQDYCVVKKVEGGVTTRYTLGFYCNTAYRSITIDKLYANGEDIDVRSICRITGDGRKVDNECDMWRLCAPNFTSQFEFKLTKLLDLIEGAEIDHFDVDITYRPFQPYIRVAPQFGFLYVTDYKDARGLICTAGFSITLVDDKWQTYELNNKNYQQMFNREIIHMENERAIAREQEQWNITRSITSAITGTVGAGLGGFLASLVNPLAGIGVGIAGINKMINSGMGIADAYKNADWNERSYKEMREMKTDMFNMSLDNIKALPSSVTQSSSISYNFKFFPVLEKYTCTDEERQMVKDKLKWNGMTVGLIGTVRGYISNTEERFIQAEIIRIENTDEDSHIVNSLYEELNKGLFFTPYIPPNKKEVA